MKTLFLTILLFAACIAMMVLLRYLLKLISHGIAVLSVVLSYLLAACIGIILKDNIPIHIPIAWLDWVVYISIGILLQQVVFQFATLQRAGVYIAHSLLIYGVFYFATWALKIDRGVIAFVILVGVITIVPRIEWFYLEADDYYSILQEDTDFWGNTVWYETDVHKPNYLMLLFDWEIRNRFLPIQYVFFAILMGGLYTVLYMKYFQVPFAVFGAPMLVFLVAAVVNVAVDFLLIKPLDDKCYDENN